jgi:hypothetical protein
MMRNAGDGCRSATAPASAGATAACALADVSAADYPSAARHSLRLCAGHSKTQNKNPYRNELPDFHVRPFSGTSPPGTSGKPAKSPRILKQHTLGKMGRPYHQYYENCGVFLLGLGGGILK